MNYLLNNDPNNTDKFQRLILAFRTLPKVKSSQTFMEVSGYPHFENVCSNILGFYFKPAAEHGLKNLLLVAFLRMVGERDTSSVGDISVSREYCSAKGRIDLVIESKFLTIGIENKIHHPVDNDLEDYSQAIDKLSKKNIKLKVVLSLNRIKDPVLMERLRTSGFVNHTYGQLWLQVREMLGHYITQAEAKWVTYLIDFMETTTNLAGQNMELKKTDLFFIENNETIETMLSERNAFLGRLTKKIEVLLELMKEQDEVKFLAEPPYLYAKDRLVLDFIFAYKYEISFDFYLTPSGWNLQLFGRNSQSINYLLTLINHPILQEKMSSTTYKEKRYFVQQWGVQDDMGEIRDALCRWINEVNDAASTLPN